MFIALFLIWIIFNGQITVELILFGLVFAAAIFWFLCKFMDYSIEKDIRYAKKTLWMIKYLFILVKEIVKANIAVVQIMISAKYKKEPVIVTFQTKLQSKVAKVILANSITLTPGTITVKLEGDEYTVHCLDKDLAVGLDTSVFVKELEKFESIK